MPCKRERGVEGVLVDKKKTFENLTTNFTTPMIQRVKE